MGDWGRRMGRKRKAEEEEGENNLPEREKIKVAIHVRKSQMQSHMLDTSPCRGVPLGVCKSAHWVYDPLGRMR